MLNRVAELLDTAPEVVALSFARMADALGNSLLIVVLPIFIARQPSPLFDLPTEFLVGLVVSLYGFLFGLGQPFAGRLTDKVGRTRPFILGGLGVMTLATVGFMFARRFIWIFALRGLQGLGVALIVPAALVLITSVTETRTRGHAMGVYSTFRMAGFAVGPLLAGVLQVHFGFDAAFIVGGGFLALAFVLVYFTVDELPREERDVPGRSSRAGSETDPTGTRTNRDRASSGGPGFLPSRSILALMFATIVLASSLSMIAALENEFNRRLSQTAIGFGIAFSALTVSRLFVQIPIGRWSDHIGRKKLIVGGLVALAPITVLHGYVQTTLQLVILRLVQGVSLAAVAAPAFALAGDLAPAGNEGHEMSFVTMGFGLGLGAGPLIAGLLAGYLGFVVPFWVVGSLAVVAAWGVWRFSRESIGPGGEVLVSKGHVQRREPAHAGASSAVRASAGRRRSPGP